MSSENRGGIELVFADEALKERFAGEWGEKSRWGTRVSQYFHLKDGFTAVAMVDGSPVGFISVYWNSLPYPLAHILEGYIDIIETFEGYKHQGIARSLIELACEKARTRGAYQLRAWSSEDKLEALPMWNALGFGMTPTKTYPGGQEVRGFFATKVL